MERGVSNEWQQGKGYYRQGGEGEQGGAHEGKEVLVREGEAYERKGRKDGSGGNIRITEWTEKRDQMAN